MLQAATAWFASSQISQNYTINAGTANSSGSSTGATTTAIAPVAPFNVGPWKVQEAFHKTTMKRASVWTCDKRAPELERIGGTGKDMVLEALKAEASSLRKLRHPCILEMVEPLEETRSELIFATEPLISSLPIAIAQNASGSGSSSRHRTVELDEIEIQKGILQLTKGLSFLHTSARIVHSNLKTDSVVINSTGDWKICGLGLTIPFADSEGRPTQWEFPAYDGRLPPYIQRSYDYMAPEYALKEQVVPASDFYSLGCVIYAVHAKGEPPFRNRGNLSSMRSNLGRLEGGGGLRGMDSWDPDLRSLVSALVTSNPVTRLTATTLPTHSYFSSLAISTLNFLDRSNFASKSREEKIAFMKGLTGVLGRFSEGMKQRKILPSLLEEMKDPLLLSSILPNVFTISSALDPAQFQSLVLPSLKPLFTIKDPPIVMMVLLENLETLQSKTTKPGFRTEVLPLVYNAMESEHADVQERALLTVPGLCDTVEYSEVQSVLFPRVALVFTKTRILSVKVGALNCFHSMVQTLDQTSLTQKLVPLLAKIRTKEPAVMMATLQVHEAMGQKVEREAVATLVLPQLWAMSVGPLLSVQQFERFMQVIKTLGDRIEREHSQYLRDSQRIEDKSSINAQAATPAFSSSMDFQTLVGGGPKTAAPQAEANGASNGASKVVNWEDDVWGSILGASESPKPGGSQRGSVSNASTPRAQSPALPITATASRPSAFASRAVSGSTLPSVRALGARPIQAHTTPLSPRATTATSAFPAISKPPERSSSAFTPASTSMTSPTVPGYSNGLMSPMKVTTPPPTNTWNSTLQPSKPNYNISLSPSTNLSSSLPLSSPPMSFGFPSQPPSQPAPFASFQPMQPAQSNTPAAAPPTMGMSLLQPMKPATPQWGGNAQKNNAALSDFDPLL